MPQLFQKAFMWWWAIGLLMLAFMFGGNWRPSPNAPRPAQVSLPALGARYRRNVGVGNFIGRVHGRTVPDGARQHRDRCCNHRGRPIWLL